MLSSQEQIIVKIHLGRLMNEGKSFTGYQVSQSVKAAIPENITSPRHISEFVRELYNRGEMAGWCTTCVIPEPVGRPMGPVLYFKQPASIIRKCASIKKKMLTWPTGGGDGTPQKQDGADAG
jgi:hypothetical protein